MSSVSLSLAPEVDGPGLFPTRDTASLTALSVLTVELSRSLILSEYNSVHAPNDHVLLSY